MSLRDKRILNWLFVEPTNCLDELSFSLYYHSKFGTQLIHAVSFPFIFLFLLMLFECLNLPILSLLYTICFTAYSGYIDKGLGLFVLILFGGVHWVGVRYYLPLLELYVLTIPMKLLVTFLLGAFFFLIIGISHPKIEGALPAFRLFEAFVSTPQLIFLLLLNWLFGYKAQLIQDLNKAADHWEQTKWHRPNYTKKYQ